MAGENDDYQDDIDNKQEGQDDNQNLPSSDDISAALDKELDAFVKDTGDDRTRQAPVDRAGRQTQDEGQDQTKAKGRAQEGDNQDRQPPTRGQGTDRLAQDDTYAPPPRQYGSRFRTDIRGNIVDANGQIVARAGQERRLFDRVHRHFQDTDKQLEAVTTRLKAFEDADQSAVKAGLTLEERGMGLRLVAAFKTDPKATIRFMLQQAQQRGTDVSDIVQGGVGLTINDIENVIKTRLQEALQPFQPIVENTRQQAEQQQMYEEARAQLSEFYEEFPQSRPHAAVIANIMGERNLSMREAWAELRVAAAENGWDLNKDLVSQAQATLERSKNPTGGGRNQQRLPDLNGRGTVNGTVSARQRRMADVDDSYDSILNGVLQDVLGT